MTWWLAQMTYIPSTTMNITIDFDETSSLSNVIYLCQITVVMRMDLPLARMTYIPSTMMKWSTILLNQHHYPVKLTTAKLWSSIAPKIATYSYDPYTKLNDQIENRFCWNSIIIQCNLPLSNYGRPLHPKLPPTRMTHILRLLHSNPLFTLHSNPFFTLNSNQS